MAHNLTIEYLNLLNELQAFNISKNIVDSLSGYLKFIYRSELENHFSAPMLWIGMYIALGSLFCIIAMVADLLHGLRSKMFWFPCEYFRINSASLTIISVAMKLPVDLTGSMPGTVDQVAKLGSMAFMCTMMANLLPCSATMKDSDLLSNMAALCLLVITLVANVCIQIQTGVVSVSTYSKDPRITTIVSSSTNVKSLPSSIENYTTIHIIYVSLLLVLLVLHVCSSLAVLKSRRILDSKYQQRQETALSNIQQATVEDLKNHVESHGIMVGSGNSQLMFTTCFPTSYVSGMICVFVTILHILTMSWTIEAILAKDYDSDYGWSMIVIVIVQFLGVVIGTIVPLARCFAFLISFDIKSSKVISSYFIDFKVESYWTNKLYEWKHAIIKLPLRRYSTMVIIQIMIRLILSFFIGFQKGVVVVCKILSLIPLLFMMCVYCLRHLKWFLKGTLISSREKNTVQSINLSRNMLEREYDMKLARRTCEGLSMSMKQLTRKSAMNQPYSLIELIVGQSTSGFQGVAMFSGMDLLHVPPLLSEIESASEVTYRDCWRLSVVTLTTLAISIPQVTQDETEKLLRSVREGLVFVEAVEEILNVTYDYVSLQKVAESLWNEVYVHHKWLGYTVHDPSFYYCSFEYIVKWFNDTAKYILYQGTMVVDEETNAYVTEVGKSNYVLFCAYSMYRITNTMMLTNRTNTDKSAVFQRLLFNSLSSTIADIIAACLTNLPQVIIMKCHTSEIDKREARVKDAAQLLGKTSQIINFLRDRDIPKMHPNDIAFFDKWIAYMKDP